MSTAKHPHLFWIPAYGGWNPGSRHAIESIGVDHYMEVIIQALSVFDPKNIRVFVSGGQKDTNGHIECDTFIAEMRKRLDARGMNLVPLYADRESRTGISVVKQFLQTWSRNYHDHTPILFCDSVRAEQNVLVLKELSGALNIHIPHTRKIVAPIHRIDIHSNSTPDAQKEKIERILRLGALEVEKQDLADLR